jgi:hypothetical protein
MMAKTSETKNVVTRGDVKVENVKGSYQPAPVERAERPKPPPPAPIKKGEDG